MSSQQLRVLVYGGTGSQARPTVSELLRRGHQPYVLTRHPERAADLAAAGAQLVIGDLANPEQLAAASAGMDGVALLIPAFLANPLAAVAYGLQALAAAKNAGVRKIVWNSSGPIPSQRSGNPMNDQRIDLLEAIQHSGIANVILEPTTYMENWLGPWTANYIIQHQQVAYPTPAHKKMGWIASADVGKLVVAAFEAPALVQHHFKISGIEAPTGPELAQHFSQALGRQLSYYAMPPREMGAIVAELFGPAAGAAIEANYQHEFDHPEAQQNYVDMHPVLQQLPVDMTSIQSWVRQHAHAFGG